MFVTITVISINGNIMQLDSRTITNDSPLVADQSTTAAIQQEVPQQNSLQV